MSFFVKVMQTGKRARIHKGSCRHCRNGQGQENQDKGTGPTYWYPAFPEPGFAALAEAEQYMANLNYRDTGPCRDCKPGTMEDIAEKSKLTGPKLERVGLTRGALPREA